jgi:integrase/recombinase XerD
MEDTGMSNFPALLQAFFTDRLAREYDASPHTISSYRDAFRLLFAFLRQQTGKQPSTLTIDDLDARTIAAFLEHLERDRHNSVRTRNARLVALRSFYRFAALHDPDHAALIARVLAIPEKRFDSHLVSYLEPAEITALLEAPDRGSWTGRRDHALLLLALQTGLRVSELAGLDRRDVTLAAGAHVRCHGKGRKDRATPLTRTTVTTLRAWLCEHDCQPTAALFPSRKGEHLTRGAIWRLVAKHAECASIGCPSLAKKRVTPHVLRHTAAMTLLHAGVDVSVIALWLGHEALESTNIYLHADMALKERALARTAPPNTAPGRYQPPDQLLAFLDNL